MDDLDFMREALALAKQASEQGEVPVGCVITRGEEIVGRGITAGKRTNPPWPTRKFRPLTRPASDWAAGGCGNAPSM